MLGNAQEEVSFSPKNSALKSVWTGKYFYGTPTFENVFINQVVKKAVVDFEVDPENTVHMFIVPNLPQASW